QGVLRLASLAGDPVELAAYHRYARRSRARIQLDHPHDERLQLGRCPWIGGPNGREDKGDAGWVASREQMMEQNAQAEQVTLRRRLGVPALLGGSVALGAKRHRVMRLTWLEEARDTKVNEIDSPSRSHHNIAGLEVTKDDGWLLLMQVVEHGAELTGDAQDLA